jgi:hypothetical protein
MTFLFKLYFSLGLISIDPSFAANLTILVETTLINVTQRSVLNRIGVRRVELP